MARMMARLEGARAALAALMQKVSGEASSTLIAGLREAGDEGDDGVKGLPGFYGAARLLMELQEIVVDAGAVRDSVASSFDKMETSVFALTAAMDDQRWLMDAEKEICSTVVQGFLREINAESKSTSSPVEGCQLAASQQHATDGTVNSSEECDSLKDETRQLQSTRRNPAERSDSCRHCNQSEEERGISHQEAERLMEEKVDLEIRCELQDVLYSATFRDLARELAVQADVHKLTEERDEVNIRSKLQDEIQSTALITMFQNDVHKLTEEKEEVGIRSKLQQEIYSNVLEALGKKLAVESVDHLIRTFVKDYVHAVSIAESLNSWKSRNEKVHNEGLIKEEIDCVIFGGLAKDLINDHNLSVIKSKGENRPRDDLGRFTMTDNIEQLQITPEDECLDPAQHGVLFKQEISSNGYNRVRQNLKESDLQAETSRDKNGVSGNAEEALEDQRQTTEMARSLNIFPQGTNQEMFIPFTNFQEMFRNFEADICGKIGIAMARLGDLDKQLANVSEQVSSLRKSELTYQRAFTRRCCDLQMAEAEVDLLGDGVELLVRLLRKTYRALDQYSPVLQHYHGIKEMLCLLGKELAMWHHVQ